jgi:tetratricopeptide (TPR) repeat protein
VVVLAAALLLAACQQTPVSQPPFSSSVSPADQLRADGDAFMAKGDYANAVEKYRQAADLDPAAITPRFALGTAYSFLEKGPEAIAQFRWVLTRADAGSAEYKEAHRWLARVGALPVPVAGADTARPGPASPPDPSSIGRLVGKTEWPEVTPQRRLITGSLTLIGDEPITHDIKRTRAFRLGDRYEFRDVPAGRYRVVAVIDETMVWDEKVTVAAGKDTNLTLSQSTSPVPAATFAPSPAALEAAGNAEASGQQ